MENAEEVMQLLEEFSKTKPKDIPRELEDYIGYVAKTGDPVFQWSLVKSLFREKLLSVITDFYESTLTVELPPCPNVEPFNYERMKTSLLERLDTFCSAPFTIQRICELLTNPRKEYNRADKYMRAIEKNILVVSTREPGSGKRPLECDSQSETVLNGIPDVKIHESDGSLLHVPTDLPYLGAPPASNDITIETTEPSSAINERLNLNVNGESITPEPIRDKSWPNEQASPESSENVDQKANTSAETLNPDRPISPNREERCPKEIDCDTSRLSNIDNTNINVSTEQLEDESSISSDIFTQNNESILPDSIDSSDSSQDFSEIQQITKQENDEAESVSDENEVSSTPGDTAVDIPLIQEETEEPTDSEAEATDSGLAQEPESEVNSLGDNEINSSERVTEETNDTKSVIISEVTATKSDEVDLECNEITGTVVSPISPGNSSTTQADELDQNINVCISEDCDQSDSRPDSSNDVCLQNITTESVELQKTELGTEADSMSDTNEDPTENQKTKSTENVPDQTNDEILVENVSQSPVESAIIEEDYLNQPTENPVLSSNSIEETVGLVNEGRYSSSSPDENNKITEVESSSEVAEEMCDQEQREESVIHSVPLAPDSQQQITIEEINVDPSCEVEEEAMEVDDTSNQMMVSEGENEGEPMDQCDQLQS